MTAELSDTEVVVRDALFEHEMFESYQRGNSSYGMESFLRIEATWAFDPAELQKSLERLALDGLIQAKDQYWHATLAGLVAREKRWQKTGRRHPALSDKAANPRDLILALVRSDAFEFEESENPSLTDTQIDVFLWDMPKATKEEALQELAAEGLVRRGGHIMDQQLAVVVMTALGLRYYAQQVAPRLGLIPPATILAPSELEVLPFDELGLAPAMADNLRYRWEEAERCMEARAWLSANIMLGSILEAVLSDWLGRSLPQAMAAKSAPKDKSKAPLPMDRWKLAELIKVSAELGLIDLALTRHANALRENRNLVHPNRQILERSNPDGNLTAISKQVVAAVLAALACATP